MSNIVFNSFEFWFYDIVEKNIFVEAIEAVWTKYLIFSHQFQTNQAAYRPDGNFA